MSQGWDSFWVARQASRQLVLREFASDRWKLIEDAVLHRYGSLEAKEVLEVGAGMGTNCLCMAIRGARPSLLDIEPMAFQRAKELFVLFDATPRLIQRDILSPPGPAWANCFDVVMSFGLAEHFTGSERELCIRRHFDWAKPGGLVITSVPNWSSFIVRFDTYLLSLARRWRWGWQRFSKRKSFDWDIEIPFTRRELEEMGSKMSADFKVYPTNFGEGINGMLRWLRYPLEAIGLHRICSRIRWSWAPMPMLDRRWGVSLVLIAQKGAKLT